MILATHAIAGAAVAQLFPANPALGFGLAVASHFALDMIPHWDYPLASLQPSPDGDKMKNSFRVSPALVADFMKTGADACLGLLISFILFYPTSANSLLILFLGVVGGILPDFLQFVFYHYRPRLLKPLQLFHIWIHAKRRLDGRPGLGIILQTLIAALVVFVLR